MFKKRIESIEVPLKVFVHIPKTAGTSFRQGLESVSKVACDYTLEETVTSKIVRKYVYEMNDNFSFVTNAKSQKYRWLSGHIKIEKYLPIVDPRNIISFVREPFARTLSLFSHKARHQGYKGDFNRFFNEKKYTNEQFKKLKGFPIELIGNLGITEKYEESIKLINETQKIKVPSYVRNVAPSKKEERITTVEITPQVLELNKKDVALYAKALWLHNQRVKMSESGLQWVHATARFNNKGILTGQAWFAECDNPVEVAVYANDKLIEKTMATLPYEGKIKTQFPRLGYVSYSFRKLADLEKGTILKVVVEGTGQQLNFKPLKVV